MQSSNTSFLEGKTEQKISQHSGEGQAREDWIPPASLLLTLMAAEVMKRLLINLRTMLVKENEKDKKGSSNGMQG